MNVPLDIEMNPRAGLRLPATDKLALAQAAFREFHSRCFWFMRPDAQLTEEDVPYICRRLRADGGRRGFFVAAKLCQ